MKKATAVQWLQDVFMQQGTILNSQFELAMEIEKEQMKNAVLFQHTAAPRLKEVFKKQFEEYYNDNFKL